VRIGADAIVGAGSAVSRDVADGELRIVRAEQLVKPGWADRFHDAMKKKKDGYSNFRSERNAWAHGHLVILPCTAPQRWENAWITLKHYDPKKGSFNQNNLRILASDLVDFTKSAKQIADNAIELRSKVDQRLPQL
jgi:hypothetical protein